MKYQKLLNGSHPRMLPETLLLQAMHEHQETWLPESDLRYFLGVLLLAVLPGSPCPGLG